jgi:putative ABC transport system substrate-binding protein
MASYLARRKFLATLGAAAATWPFAARAQHAGKVPTIGLLIPGTPSTHGQWFAALVQRLRELGWIEGRTIAFEYRWAEGREDRYTDIAAEFVRLKIDVIVTAGGALLPTQQATSAIPIVFAVANDPVGSGFVASLPRPGGNVTGLSNQQSDTASKRVELLREFVSGLHRLAVVVNTGFPSSVREAQEVQEIARTLGLEAAALEIRRAEDLAPGFEAFKGRAEAVYVVGDAFVNTNRTRINTLALAARLPTMYDNQDYVAAGGLMSYGPNFADLFRRAGDFVDKILRGAKPADLPVEQPTKFDLVINLTTARALGLEVPPTLLARADEVIE